LRSRGNWVICSARIPNTYLELLPTPAHDFKAITEWMTEEIFHRYMKPKQSGRGFQGIGAQQQLVVLVGGILLAWRVIQPA